ncbi:MAG: glutaminase A [Capsulimonadales bacterium]|nr:glutaminase A [Capsulimonadales bacterium]
MNDSTTESALSAYLRELWERYHDLADGDVADYIPELSRADPNWFGIAVVTTDGQVAEVGDTGQRFTIQSASKPFTFGLALELWGREHILTRVGVEPTGDRFNSIQLDERAGRPFNPMINAGAIAIADLIPGSDTPERQHRLLDCFRRYTGRKEVFFDLPTFTSEAATGHRNRAIVHLMRAFGMVGERFEESLDLYFQQCAILVSCTDLAVMAATLANGGIHPITGERAAAASCIAPILSVMYTCGMYDSAGEWAYRVGLPAKSGVSGAIFAVVPGQGGIAVFSPRVDAHGNSVRGVRVCEDLSIRYGLHLFDDRRGATTLLDAARTPV